MAAVCYGGLMNTMTVAEFKAGFSAVLAGVRRGERYGVLYGRSQTPVAMLVPFAPERRMKRKLGPMDGKLTLEFRDGFEMSDAELLGAE
jgi:antitoxin (DNA-binding transcriptional repressor) of toxin-antitoxin stability system